MAFPTLDYDLSNRTDVPSSLGGKAIQMVRFSKALTTAMLAVGIVTKLGELPAGSRIVGGYLEVPDMDSNGSPERRRRLVPELERPMENAVERLDSITSRIETARRRFGPPPEKVALIAGAEAGDAEHCARLAHKLRGAAFNLGLERLGHCAASLEQEIGQIEADGKLAERVQDLVGIHERTLQALAQMLDAAPGRPDADAA